MIDFSLYKKYEVVLERAVNRATGVIGFVNEDETDYDTLVKSCCAYYGDRGHLAHMFRNAGKPVMIQNYEI